MIEQEMQFHGPFGPSERGPWEQRQTEGYGRAVQGEQLVLESEFVFSWSCTFTYRKGLVEEISEHLPCPMGIGIGEGGFVGGILHTEMMELAEAAGKSPAYLSEALGLC